MPADTRKRKSPPAVDNKTTKPARRTNRSAKAPAKQQGGRIGEDESVDDETYDSSGSGPANASSIITHPKRHLNIDDAKASIRDETARLIKTLESQDHRSLMQHVDSIKGLQLDKSVVGVTSNSTTAKAQSISSNEAFREPGHVIEEIMTTVKEYEAVSKDRSQLDRPTWMRWEQDTKDLHALNQEAMGVAARSIHESIVSTKLASITGPSDTATDIEKVAWDLLAETRPRNPTHRWGTAAQEILRLAVGVMASISEGESLGERIREYGK